MRVVSLLILIGALLDMPVIGQEPPSRRSRAVSPHTHGIEQAVKRAAERLANERKIFERDINVLRHLRAADDALADDMQPTAAIQKAYEQVDEAHRLEPPFVVQQGVIRIRQELESARRSPLSADFGRLRLLLREHALGPAARVAVANATRLQEETVAWTKIQELIAAHIRSLAEITGESLQASQ